MFYLEPCVDAPSSVRPVPLQNMFEKEFHDLGSVSQSQGHHSTKDGSGLVTGESSLESVASVMDSTEHTR